MHEIAFFKKISRSAQLGPFGAKFCRTNRNDMAMRSAVHKDHNSATLIS